MSLDIYLSYPFTSSRQVRDVVEFGSPVFQDGNESFQCLPLHRRKYLIINHRFVSPFLFTYSRFTSHRFCKSGSYLPSTVVTTPPLSPVVPVKRYWTHRKGVVRKGIGKLLTYHKGTSL